jgi:hypothetical protein
MSHYPIKCEGASNEKYHAFISAVLGFCRRLSGANTAQRNSGLQPQAKLSPQNGDDTAAGAYEDDIDGVAIKSMSTQSEGEPEDE